MMKKNIILLLISLVLVGCSSPRINSTSIKDINDFNRIDNNYYLIYPSDSRTTQDYTYIKELDSEGKDIKTYKVNNLDLRRIDSFQNPLYPHIISLQLFGEATLDTSYYEYNLKSSTFEEKKFDFFDYDVGINSLFSFGKDTILSTVVSHKTGEQNTTDDGRFQMSISNTSTGASVETPYNAVPMATASFNFQNKGIYMTSGYLESINEEENTDSFNNKGIGIVDFTSDNVTFLNPEDKKNIEYWSVYSNETNFYVFSDLGTLFKYDEKFSYERFFPLNNYNDVSFSAINKVIYLNNSKILCSFYSGIQQIVGTLSIEDNKFTELNYLKEYENIRFLYYNSENSRIYLTSDNGTNGNLICLNSSDLSIKKVIPIEDPWALDFVIHN